jgi:hypothetical protein
MEIHHKPKPAHSWREFLKEYAIIVLGVATALAGEQALETLHNRGRAAEARASIRAEIAQNLSFLNRREATEACLAKRLDEVNALISAAADGKLPKDPLWIGAPITSVIDDGKYKTATQSGSASLFDDREQGAYATIYGMIEVYRYAVLDEQNDWANLRTLESHPPASPTLDWQLRSALQMARIHRYEIQATRVVALRAAARLGIAPARLSITSVPWVCVPLHASRQEAIKLSHDPTWSLEPP